jgi:hypothetical protein
MAPCRCVPFGSFVAGLSLTGGRELGAVNSGHLCGVHNQGSVSPVLGLLACILVLSVCLLALPCIPMVPSLSLHCHVLHSMFSFSVSSLSLPFGLRSRGGGRDGRPATVQLAANPQQSWVSACKFSSRPYRLRGLSPCPSPATRASNTCINWLEASSRRVCSAATS